MLYQGPTGGQMVRLIVADRALGERGRSEPWVPRTGGQSSVIWHPEQVTILNGISSQYDSGQSGLAIRNTTSA
jgi:hypothetical protein